LERAHLQADRRGGEAELGGRGGEAAVPRHGEEDLERADRRHGGGARAHRGLVKNYFI
jgi:hypothetical protein